MEFKRIGEDKISMLGLGTWQSEGDECTKAVIHALEIGYTHIDTADMYKNHQQIKKALDKFDRSNIFITTKLWFDDFEKPRENVERFLNELGIEYLDLALLHWPDSSKDMVSTLKELQKMKEEKIIKHVGVSNFTIKHLQELLDAGIVPEMNQVEYHPMLNQEELLSFCKQNGILVTAYSPLGRGKIIDDERLKEIAEKYGKSVPQVILRWHIQKDIIAIPKSTDRDHIESNIDIFDFELSKEDMDKVDSMNENDRIINPDFAEFDK